MQQVKSDIWGSFELFNKDIKNIKLYSKYDILSLLINGNYNIQNKNANLCLYIRYNKYLLQGVKILFIPASWVLSFAFQKENSLILYKHKIDEIPPIKKTSKEEILKIILSGNVDDLSNMQKSLKILK